MILYLIRYQKRCYKVKFWINWIENPTLIGYIQSNLCVFFYHLLTINTIRKLTNTNEYTNRIFLLVNCGKCFWLNIPSQYQSVNTNANISSIFIEWITLKRNERTLLSLSYFFFFSLFLSATNTINLPNFITNQHPTTNLASPTSSLSSSLCRHNFEHLKLNKHTCTNIWFY